VVLRREGLRFHLCSRRGKEEGEDLFVRYSEIEGSGFRSLMEGERVVYEAAPRDARGARAIKVRRIE